jgi:hypothetical protein
MSWVYQKFDPDRPVRIKGNPERDLYRELDRMRDAFGAVVRERGATGRLVTNHELIAIAKITPDDAHRFARAAAAESLREAGRLLGVRIRWTPRRGWTIIPRSGGATHGG